MQLEKLRCFLQESMYARPQFCPHVRWLGLKSTYAWRSHQLVLLQDIYKPKIYVVQPITRAASFTTSKEIAAICGAKLLQCCKAVHCFQHEIQDDVHNQMGVATRSENRASRAAADTSKWSNLCSVPPPPESDDRGLVHFRCAQ